MKKVVVIILLIAVIFLALYGYFFKWNNYKVDEKNILAPLTEIIETPREKLASKSIFNKDEVINILLIGADIGSERISNGQSSFNTDIMILLSMNIETNKVLLTSIPRDLWINGNKLNALYIVYGYETLEDAFEQMSDQKIKGYIRVDFDSFRWLVDSMGGVPVDVERSFTDYNFPNNYDTNITTVSFTQGYEKMNSQRALTFARSRKGTNGEGSDLMRAKRQHLILQGMVEAIKQPQSIFWPPDNIPEIYELLTQKLETSLTLEDVTYLWDFYKDKDLYTVESFVVDGTYLYHPGMYPVSSYHAWVFIPKEGALTQLHQDIEAKLNGIFVDETAVSTTEEESL